MLCRLRLLPSEHVAHVGTTWVLELAHGSYMQAAKLGWPYLRCCASLWVANGARMGRQGGRRVGACRWHRRDAGRRWHPGRGRCGKHGSVGVLKLVH
eukprot:345446-Chlamydomonas_euryale.AAC.2